jgi:ankyrin repeat protein
MGLRKFRISIIAFIFVATSFAAPAGAGLVDVIKSGDRATALAMLQKGADVNEPEANGTTPLHYAVYNEDADLVERLIKAGAKVSVVNDFGSTPMAEAAAVGNAAIIKMLLKAGADVNSRNREGQTALMAVARTGSVDAARLLLEAGADVNSTEQWGGQSALMWAAAQEQPAMVKFLIEHGADVDARGAVRDWQRRITAETRPKDMDRGGYTALLYAAREGCVECARHLVEGGASINLPDPNRETPLVLALINMRFDTAFYLISAGADVDKWDLYGRTPLFAAVDMSTLPRGGRPDIPSSDETSALQVIKLLLDKGANPNIQLKLRPPFRAVILDRGSDNAILTIGATPLLRASKAGDNPDAIQLLLDHGALVDLPNVLGITPLLTAAGMGHSDNASRGKFNTDEDGLKAIQILLKAGADINARNADGQTALHSAAQKGWNKVIKFLVENGVPLEATDAGGKTALDFAKGNSGGGRQAPHPETVALLEKLIADRATKRP